MEKEQWTQQMKSKTLRLHIKTSIWSIKRIQSFLCHQTMNKVCDQMVTLFILYHKSHQNIFFFILSSIR